MKALVKAKSEPGIWCQDLPVPEIGPGEILVKVSKTGICGTDIHIFNWDEWARRTVPVGTTLGHEFSGTVVEKAPDVSSVAIGQRVSAEGHLVSQGSRASRAGRFHLDPDTQGIGVTVAGAFAEYVKLPAFNAVPLPDAIDDEIGAILDPLGNALHTALSFDLVGEDVLVTGAGPIGIMAAAVARHVGARHVVITDINPERLALAAKVADVTPVDVRHEDLHDVMARLGMREGFDVGLEMSGAPPAFDQLLECLVMGGRIALLGLPTAKVPLDIGRIAFRMLTLKGIYGREMFETWHKMLAMLQTGLDVRGVITHRIAADDFQFGFDTMAAGRSGKIVIDWN